MIEIEQIAIDMDGVLADFHKRFKELYQNEPEVDYVSNNKRNKSYRKNFHDFVESKQFATLDPMPDLQEGLDYLKTLDVHMWILTSTAKEEYLNEISAQKKIWLKNHNIPYHPVFVPGKRMKCYYSKPRRILIDDTVSNIESWIEGGGVGILHTNWIDTINTLKQYF